MVANDSTGADRDPKEQNELLDSWRESVVPGSATKRDGTAGCMDRRPNGKGRGWVFFGGPPTFFLGGSMGCFGAAALLGAFHLGHVPLLLILGGLCCLMYWRVVVCRAKAAQLR